MAKNESKTGSKTDKLRWTLMDKKSPFMCSRWSSMQIPSHLKSSACWGSNPLTHLKSTWIYRAQQLTKCFSYCCHDSIIDSTLKMLSTSLIWLSEQWHFQMSTRTTPKYTSEQYKAKGTILKWHKRTRHKIRGFSPCREAGFLSTEPCLNNFIASFLSQCVELVHPRLVPSSLSRREAWLA